MVARPAAEILSAPDQPRLNPAESEVARHHDRIEALQKCERDLRRRAEAEHIGENRKQCDFRDRIAEKENRLEQIADERGASHRRGERNSDDRRKHEPGERAVQGHARMVGQRAIAYVGNEGGPDPPRTRQQARLDKAGSDRRLPDQQEQRNRIPAGDQAPGRYRTICSSVPIVWPLSTRARIASRMRSLTKPKTAKQTMPANIMSKRTHSSA